MNEAEWLLLVGIIIPFVIQGVKTVYDKINGAPMSEKAALNTTYVLAIIAAGIGKYLSGEAIIPQGALVDVAPLLLAQAALVLGSATAIYKMFISKTTGIRAP